MSPDEILNRFRGTAKGGGNTKGKYNPNDPTSIVGSFYKRFNAARIDPKRQSRAGGLDNLDEAQLASLGYKPTDIQGSKVTRQQEEAQRKRTLESAIMDIAGASGDNYRTAQTKKPTDVKPLPQVYRDPNRFGAGRGPANNSRQVGLWEALGEVAKPVSDTFLNTTVDTARQLYRVNTGDPTANPELKKALQDGDFEAFVKQMFGRGAGIASEVAPFARGANATYKGAKGIQVAKDVAKTAGAYGAVGTGGQALRGEKVGIQDLATNTLAAGVGEAVGAVGGKFVSSIKKALSKADNGIPKLSTKELVAYETTDPKRVKYWEGEIKAGREKPIVVLPDSSGKIGVEDGKHRLQAYKNLGIKDVPIDVDTSLARAKDLAVPTIPSRTEQALVPKERGGFVRVAGEKISKEGKQVREAIVSGVPKQPKGTALKETRETIYDQLVDRLAPLNRLRKQVEAETGQKLAFADDPYKLARVSAGREGKMSLKLEELGSIYREADNPNILKEMGVLRRITTDRSGIKNPVPLDVAQKRLTQLEAELGPEKFKQYNEVVDKVIKFNDDTLKYLADNGIISKESYAAIKKNNQNYFAKFDVVDYLLENGDNMKRGNSFNVARQDLIKAQKGTEAKIADPLEANIRQLVKAIDTVERNRVGQALYKLKDTGFVTEFTGGTVPKDAAKISVFIDGKKTDLLVPEEVGEAFKALDEKQMDFITRWIAGPQTRLLRAGATGLNVGFSVTNALRDFKNLSLNSQYIPIVKLLPAWVGGLKSSLLRGFPGIDDTYRKFLAGGGGQSTFFGRAAGDVADEAQRQLKGGAAWKTITKPSELLGLRKIIEAVGETAELAPRLAEFKAAQKAGKGLEEAAFAGRDVTTDFAVKGSVSKVMNNWIPFLTARIGGARITLKAIKENPKRALTVGTFLVGLPAVATYVHNRQYFSEEFDEIPNYIKDNNFVIIYGKGRDADGNLTDVIRIPKGDFDKLLANPLENFMDAANGRDSKNFLQVATQALSDFSPIEFAKNGNLSGTAVIGSALPPAVKAVAEYQTNYSFFREAPLVSERLADLPNSEQVYDSTSGLARTIGGVTGGSPIKIDNAIRNLTGGGAKQFTEPLTLGDQISGRVKGVKGNQIETDFYDLRAKVEPKKNLANKRVSEAVRAGRDDEARKIAQEYNQELEKQFSSFNRQFYDRLSPEIKDRYEKLKINLTDRSIKSRRRAK